jgi:PAS domain-containing protein
MNIRTKLILSVGVLAGMIILLVALSVVNLQILTATEPDSPAAVPGLQRALLWISVIGGVCIFASIILLVWLPRSISKPIQELTRGILEIANHNYEKRLDMSGREEFREVADSFNRMAERLTEYRASTLNDILSAKKFLEAIVNSIDEPIIGLNRNREILFINNEALTVLNLKREEVIRRSAEELSLKNDLLRRLVRELVNPGEKKEPLKIYADNKESYFKASYITIINAEADSVDRCALHGRTRCRVLCRQTLLITQIPLCTIQVRLRIHRTGTDIQIHHPQKHLTTQEHPEKYPGNRRFLQFSQCFLFWYIFQETNRHVSATVPQKIENVTLSTG